MRNNTYKPEKLIEKPLTADEILDYMEIWKSNPVRIYKDFQGNLPMDRMAEIIQLYFQPIHLHFSKGINKFDTMGMCGEVTKQIWALPQEVRNEIRQNRSMFFLREFVKMMLMGRVIIDKLEKDELERLKQVAEEKSGVLKYPLDFVRVSNKFNVIPNPKRNNPGLKFSEEDMENIKNMYCQVVANVLAQRFERTITVNGMVSEFISSSERLDNLNLEEIREEKDKMETELRIKKYRLATIENAMAVLKDEFDVEISGFANDPRGRIVHRLAGLKNSIVELERKINEFALKLGENSNQTYVL